MRFLSRHKEELNKMKQECDLLQEQHLQYEQAYHELQIKYEQLLNQSEQYKEFYDVCMRVEQKVVDVPDLVDDITNMPNAYKQIWASILNAIAQSVAFDAVTKIKDTYYIPYIEWQLAFVQIMKNLIGNAHKDEGEKVSLITRTPIDKKDKNLDKKTR